MTTSTTETPTGMDVIWKIASPADMELWKAEGAIVGQGGTNARHSTATQRPEICELLLVSVGLS